eukprot:EG_transcript_8798
MTASLKPIFCCTLIFALLAAMILVNTTDKTVHHQLSNYKTASSTRISARSLPTRPLVLHSVKSEINPSHPENHFEAKQQLQNVSQALSPKFTVVLLSTVSAALAVFLRGRRRSDSKPLASAAIAMASTTSVKPAWEQKKALDPKKRILVVGCTGYIGKYATLELIRRGYDVVAMARERSGVKGKKSAEDVIADFPGAKVVFGDVCNPASLAKAFEENAGTGFDTVVSCLASRTGGIADSWRIDYEATKNVLQAARNSKARHFVLLSAICVQKPLLEFQRAKLKFEEELMAAGDITYSIVRPTAFFKSLAGQVKSVKGGGPYVMFGDGQLAACKPISERDLAAFMADCVEDETKVNKVLPVGGPGEALTPLQQGNLLFSILGKDPFFIKVPVALMDAVIGVLDFFKQFNKDLVDAAEFGRIGKYYATESMLVYDPAAQAYLPGSETPSYGTDTLEDFFRNAVKEGGLDGQELGDAAVFSD